MKVVSVGDIDLANELPLALIAGPCQIENLQHALKLAKELKSICDELGVGFLYKSSFDKANRSSMGSPRGAGLEEGLEILVAVNQEIGCPVLTDVHSVEQCKIAAKCVDVLQIPAFLCRQTDLLIAAGETGRAIHVKKGQFLAPWDMRYVVEKIESTGNSDILLCERGTSFGYNTLVTDMRSLPILASSGFPVVIDATHSVQQPGGQGARSGGQREFAPVIARAAVAVGVAAVFMETHENPDDAPSDGPNMLPLDQIRSILRTLVKIDNVAKSDLTRI